MARVRAENEGLKAVLAAKDQTIEAQAAAMRLLAAPPARPAEGGRYDHTFEAQDGMKAARQPRLWASIKRFW